MARRFSANSRRDSGDTGKKDAAASPAASPPSSVKRKSTGFSHKGFESGIKSPKVTDANTILLEKVAEFASKDVYSKGSGECLFSKGDKTADRVHISGGDREVKALYAGLQDHCGVGEKDRPEYGGQM